jgi:hypothetical protein
MAVSLKRPARGSRKVICLELKGSASILGTSCDHLAAAVPAHTSRALILEFSGSRVLGLSIFKLSAPSS